MGCLGFGTKKMTKAIYVLVMIIIILLFALIASYSFLSDSPHIWPSVNETISYNGKPSPEAELYVGPSESVLIDLRHEGDGLYVVNVDTQEIGIPNKSNFYFAFGYAYSKQISPQLVSLGKAETVSDSRIQPYEVEFTSANKARVHVRWHLNY